MKQTDSYEWLVGEVAQVRWKGFFSLTPGAPREPSSAVTSAFGQLPADYVRFVEQFGEARLFRELRRGSYSLAVFARPRIRAGKNGAILLEIGFFLNGGYAHFRKCAGKSNIDPVVFEGTGPQIRKVADSFADWLQQRFERCKRLYKKAEWKRIVAGALPFTTTELSIVEAIKLYSFERVGTASNGDAQIRVHNGSTLRLSHLTIGANAPGRLNGTIYLDVSNIGPGESQILEHACYKSLLASEKIELFRKPPPEPEDRGLYYEFGNFGMRAKLQ